MAIPTVTEASGDELIAVRRSTRHASASRMELLEREEMLAGLARFFIAQHDPVEQHAALDYLKRLVDSIILRERAAAGLGIHPEPAEEATRYLRAAVNNLNAALTGLAAVPRR